MDCTNLITFVEQREAGGLAARAILDQLLAYWHAEQAERDAETERAMEHERDRLGRLAESYGCCVPSY